MLTVEEARRIANTWRPQFSDEEAFNVSWQRFMDHVKNQSPEGLVSWLQTDLERDAVRAAGIVREPLLPVRQNLEIDESSCPICRGKHFVRHDVDIDHPDFGKVFRCPRCGSR